MSIIENNPEAFIDITNNTKLNVIFYYSNIFIDKNIIEMIKEAKLKFEKVSKEFEWNENINFYLINVDEDQRTWNAFNIHSVPSIHLIKHNLKVWNIDYDIEENIIKKKINNILN